jgi:hypothetical protein
MFAVPTLLLLLASNDLPVAEAPARAELEVCAARIEELKARHELGAELHRLLRRAQELAAELEQSSAAEAAPRDELATPTADELRERADAARDEADRLAAEIAALDIRIEDARRGQADGGATFERAALGTAAVRASGPGARVRQLHAERAALSERRRRVEADVARLDAAARAADRAELERLPP